MNREQVLEQLQPLVEGEVRDVRDATRTRITVTPDMITLRPTRGARVIEMATEGAVSMLDVIGLSQGVAKLLSPSTFGTVASELLSRQGKYALILKEDKVVSITKYGERSPVPPVRLLSTVERAIPVQDYARVVVAARQGIAMLEVVGERTQPIVRGDLVRAGLKVDFSPMGIIAPSVQSYAQVLACTNGAVSNAVLAEYTGGGGEGDDIWQWFRDSIRQAYGAFSQVVEGWRKLADEEILPADRAMMLEALIHQARLPRNIAEAVRAMALENPPSNSWQMHNLLTYASTHLLTETRHVQRAQFTSANFADEYRHAKSCPVCHQAR